MVGISGILAEGTLYNSQRGPFACVNIEIVVTQALDLLL